MKQEIVSIEEKRLPKTCQNLTLEQIVSNPKSDIKRGPFGSSITKDMFVPSGYKIYEQKNAIQNNFEIGSYFIDEIKFEQMKDFEVKEDDLIISCSGTIGKVAIVPKNAHRGIINQALLKITLDTKRMLPTYFKYLFESEFLQKKFVDNTMGGTIKNVASVKELKKISFPVPSIIEQQKIVDKLNNQMAQIEMMKKEAERQLEVSEVLFDSIINSTIKFFEPEKNTEWKLIKLGKICQINPRIQEKITSSDNQNTSFIPMESVNEELGIIDAIKIVPFIKVKKGYTYFEENDILFAKITPCMQNKKSCIAKNLINGFGFGTTEFHVMRCLNNVIPEWIFYIIRSHKFIEDAKKHFTGAVGQQRVSKDFLENYPIFIPPISEQENNVKFLNKKSKENEYIKKQIRVQVHAINQLPASILNEVFGQYQINS
ncbi:MAG: restriction endonuclease subunit S [Candidatus Methanoperedens sp.]|nr:restriction endonuclease subunit S [Candidatus Methanoperedens sp.]